MNAPAAVAQMISTCPSVHLNLSTLHIKHTVSGTSSGTSPIKSIVSRASRKPRTGLEACSENTCESWTTHSFRTFLHSRSYGAGQPAVFFRTRALRLAGYATGPFASGKREACALHRHLETANQIDDWAGAVYSHINTNLT